MCSRARHASSRRRQGIAHHPRRLYRQQPPPRFAHSRSRPASRVPRAGTLSAPVSTRQIWTALQHHGPNHLGLWLIAERVGRARGGGARPSGGDGARPAARPLLFGGAPLETPLSKRSASRDSMRRIRPATLLSPSACNPRCLLDILLKSYSNAEDLKRLTHAAHTH